MNLWKFMNYYNFYAKSASWSYTSIAVLSIFLKQLTNEHFPTVRMDEDHVNDVVREVGPTKV